MPEQADDADDADEHQGVGTIARMP